MLQASLFVCKPRTGHLSVLDHINNVTCLGPSDQAFLQAGSPDTKANVSALSSELEFHTIPGVLYSNFLQDGQTFTSLSNQTIRATFQDGAIFFNDAKAIQLNTMLVDRSIEISRGFRLW